MLKILIFNNIWLEKFDSQENVYRDQFGNQDSTTVATKSIFPPLYLL